MKLKIEKVNELMQTYYGGNYTQFAKALSLDPSHLHRALKKDIGGGNKVISGIMRFCRSNGLDADEYIDFE